MKKSYLVSLALILSLILIVNGCGKLANSSVGRFVKKNQVAVAAGTAAVGLLLFLSGGGGGGSATTTTTSTTTTTTTTSTTTTLPTYLISGTVNFATTDDGIRGGAVITLEAASSVVITTTNAAVSDGTYSFGNVDPGNYSLLISKSGWTISSIEVVVTAESRTDQDFTANPDGWTIQNIGGGITLETITVDTIEAIAYAAGVDGVDPIVLSSPTGSSAWSEALTSYNSAESIVKIYFTLTGRHKILTIFDRVVMAFVSFSPYDTLTPAAMLTSEAITDLDFISGTATYEVVTETGRLLHCDDLTNWSDITPTGKSINGVDMIATTIRFAVGDDGYIATKFAGSAWFSYSGLLKTTDNLREIAISINFGSDFFAIIVSDNGSIFTSTGLITWDQVLSGLPYALRGIYAANTTNLSGAYVVGENGLIMKKD